MSEPREPALILVVDDIEPVRALMSRALAESGYEVLVASFAECALELVAERGERLSLAVIDVHLGGTDGPTLARILRRDHPSLPVLFVSGYGEAEQRSPLGDYMLAKPFNLDTLTRHVRQLLAGRSNEPGGEGQACAS